MWALGFRVNKCSSHTREAAEKYKACTTEGALLEQLSRELRHIQSYHWQNEAPEMRGTGPKLWGCSHWVLCTTMSAKCIMSLWCERLRVFRSTVYHFIVHGLEKASRLLKGSGSSGRIIQKVIIALQDILCGHSASEYHLARVRQSH